MKLTANTKYYLKGAGAALLILAVIALIIGGVVYKLTQFSANTQYKRIETRIVNADYYLTDATILDHHSFNPGKYNWEYDFHVSIPRDKAQEMVAQEKILQDCNPFKTGCPSPTWQPYDFYVTSYGKTYTRAVGSGKIETRTNNPIVTNLSARSDKDQISCSAFQRSENVGYGICINPSSGDLWYHELKF